MLSHVPVPEEFNAESAQMGGVILGQITYRAWQNVCATYQCQLSHSFAHLSCLDWIVHDLQYKSDTRRMQRTRCSLPIEVLLMREEAAKMSGGGWDSLKSMAVSEILKGDVDRLAVLVHYIRYMIARFLVDKCGHHNTPERRETFSSPTFLKRRNLIK